MSLADCLLLRALRDPEGLAAWDEGDWDLLVRQAQSAGLLGRIDALARGHGLEQSIPAAVRRHLAAAAAIVERQRAAVRWEVHHLEKALAGIQGRVVLLKGAAYAMADLSPAAGRTFSDVDILVPKAVLPEAEMRLHLAGWISTHLDPYDQRFYREWMHELPPMLHERRETSLDVHHNILPETARTRTRPDLILAAAIPIPGYAHIHVPCPEDLILHSATHLFLEGEWWHGLRDLSDLDYLLREFGKTDGFWPGLLERGQRLNLLAPLYHALRQARALLHTPIPETMMAGASTGMRQPLMDFLFEHAMEVAHHSFQGPYTRPAEFILYIRSHWLKMPLHLLLPHLIYKAFKKEDSEE